MRVREKILHILVFLMLLSLVIFWICFSNANPRNYFSAPLHSIITIALGLFVSYYLVQKNTDKRKRCELAEKLFEQLKLKTTEMLTILHSEKVDIRRILGLKRAMVNKLNNCSQIKLCSSEHIAKCRDELVNLDRAIENGVINLAEGEGSTINNKQDIIKILEDIEYHCDKIIIELWKK